MTRKSSRRAAAPLNRQRVSEQVFDALVNAILSGELKPGEPLAPQRALGQELDVSPLLVRQAIHRLEELGLVRVRQGSPTIVLDPDESTDIRVLQRRIESAAGNMELIASVLEVQLLTALPLLFLAERRRSDADLKKLTRLTEELSDDAAPAEVQRFLSQYWTTVASASRNRLLQHQTRWWWALAERARERGRGIPTRGVAPATLRHNYHKLTAALHAGRGALSTHLKAIAPLLPWLDAFRMAAEPETAQKKSETGTSKPVRRARRKA